MDYRAVGTAYENIYMFLELLTDFGLYHRVWDYPPHQN